MTASTTDVKLYTLKYSDTKTYLFVLLFVIGNILLPQLCHLVPRGGITLLPIYFFTLIASYKYGWRVGIITAILSPIVNSILFSMPSSALLPAILAKSTLLAIIAGLAANKIKRVTIPTLALVVANYQAIGTLAQWILTGSLSLALQDVKIGIPGMLLQIFGGYLFLRYIIKK